MTTSTSLVTTQQNNAVDIFSDVFSDLDPIDPFDLKKDYLAAQMAALISYSGKSRSNLVEELGWKKSRVSNILSGKCNFTIKTIWEFSTCLGFDFDVVFRDPSELPPNQPWQIRGLNAMPMGTMPIGTVLELQLAIDVAHDFLTGRHKEFYISAVPSHATGSIPSISNNLVQGNVVPMSSVAAIQIPIKL